MSNDEWLLGEMNVYADSLPAPTGLVANIGAENEVTVSWNDMSSGEKVTHKRSFSLTNCSKDDSLLSQFTFNQRKGTISY